MKKININALKKVSILQDLFKEDTYDEYKINKFLDQGLISPQEAGLMIGYLNA